jgi:glucosamine 6-phosphate synthetase-like amidotransferase/phosphosugar isomerase protein
MLYLLVSALKGEENLGDEVRGLPELSREVLEAEWEGTERYRYADYMVVTSRGYNLATAEEAALKLMETTYIVAQAFSTADLRHGPIRAPSATPKISTDLSLQQAALGKLADRPSVRRRALQRLHRSPVLPDCE